MLLRAPLLTGRQESGTGYSQCTSLCEIVAHLGHHVTIASLTILCSPTLEFQISPESLHKWESGPTGQNKEAIVDLAGGFAVFAFQAGYKLEDARCEPFTCSTGSYDACKARLLSLWQLHALVIAQGESHSMANLWQDHSETIHLLYQLF